MARLGKSEAPDERRVVPRTRVEVPMSYRVLEAGVGTARDEPGQLLDLSIAGAAFSTDRELPLHVKLRLDIPAPDADLASDTTPPTRQIKGTVVNCRHTESNGWRYGVKFEKLYYTLADWVRQLAELRSR